MGVEKTIKQEGTGPQPNKGQTISMHYTGWVQDQSKPDGHGKEFDSSRKPGRGPLSCPIGVGRLIKGWDEAVPTMKVGEKATLTISPDYGYGASGIPNVIPPNATLIFDVELVSIG